MKANMGAAVQLLAVMLSAVFERLREPSTHAGVGVLLALAGVNVPEEQLGQILQGLAALFSVIAIARKERAA